MDYKKTLSEYKARLRTATKEASVAKEGCANCPTTPEYIRADAAVEAYDNALLWLDDAVAHTDRMEFASREHRIFWIKMIKMTGKDDIEYSVLFYVLGILEDTRTHINDLYDVKRGIKPSGLRKAWQTSGTYQACLLAFNLFNGFTDDAECCTPYELFDGCDASLSRYMLEAIKIRHYIY